MRGCRGDGVGVGLEPRRKSVDLEREEDGDWLAETHSGDCAGEGAVWGQEYGRPVRAREGCVQEKLIGCAVARQLWYQDIGIVRNKDLSTATLRGDTSAAGYSTLYTDGSAVPRSSAGRTCPSFRRSMIQCAQ